MTTYKIKQIYKNNLTDTKLKEIINKKLYKIIELIEFNDNYLKQTYNITNYNN